MQQALLQRTLLHMVTLAALAQQLYDDLPASAHMRPLTVACLKSISPHLRGVDPLETAATLDDLAEVLRDLTRVYVDRCRADGATWQAVADGLGVTRQAASQRFA
jgi:hypothetical protein